MSNSIRALAKDMVIRKKSQLDPYVLFLGAGASISSGCSSMIQIIDDVLKTEDPTQFNEWVEKIKNATSKDELFGQLLTKDIGEQKRKLFDDIWNEFDREHQYAILREHLWEKKSPSDGYSHLSQLIKQEYFQFIISTNLDTLMEKALHENLHWYSPDNFLLIVNKKHQPEDILEQINSHHAPIKVIKLHGSLESPGSYAFTRKEIFDFEGIIKPTISRIANQNLIIVGYSGQDRDIDVLFEEEGKEIHFVNPTAPESGNRMETILEMRDSGKIIDGNDAEFDNFFRSLCRFIEEDEYFDNSQSGSSIESFLKNIGYDQELEVPRSRFRNLPNLYVKPTEYDDIILKLERDHIVFIIGEPHIGKTYAAFYLLWEYYQEGYEPIHIRHDKLVYLLHKHENNIRSMLNELFYGETNIPRIIHFDDPFGETMERRTDVFAKELDTFLDLAREYENLRVIVTTRFNIFREAITEDHDIKEIEKLEKDLRVHTSYRREVLLEILHRYTQFYQPLWSSNKVIVEKLDEYLPDRLPAPHNIEFFVRTSEKLNSLEDVLNHVDISREMIKALGAWMASLPDHEKIFLICVEIYSTANVIFPDAAFSKMDIEGVYKETLAYMFRNDHIPGIPTSPFSRARDKFDMILLENKDDENAARFDFVHPSYHEAFWYAIESKLAMHRWWDLSKDNYEEIFKNFENKIDLVQLRMIERYGSVNRDLDALLLISAISTDPSEQLIAFKHMLEQIYKFGGKDQFTQCAHSLIKSKPNEYLALVDGCFDGLSQDILNETEQLVFNPNGNVRSLAEQLVWNHFDIMPENFKNNEKISIWAIRQKLDIDTDALKTIFLKPFLYEAMKNETSEKLMFSEFTKYWDKRLPSDIKETGCIAFISNINYIVFFYDVIPKDQKEIFIKAISSEKLRYDQEIDMNKLEFRKFPNSALIDFLSVSNFSKNSYNELLYRYGTLSSDEKLAIEHFIHRDD